MCGICGFVSDRKIEIDDLERMNNMMLHRGPDDYGTESFRVSGGKALGFAQRRLSILDLSASGHQPMYSADRRLLVTYNGEIYNFRELRSELIDYPFKSNCDTEVILAAYLKWGINCVEHFNGMFALALYDKQIDELFLVRDRMGKKPLYYWLDGSNIVFASTLRPIMCCPGFKKTINTRVLQAYLINQYINAPYSIFEDVYKLEPGAVLRYDHGKVSRWKYWDVAEKYHTMQQEQVISYDEAKETLHKLLIESVRRRMISDVPLGSFLSGGYDSSLITAIAQSISHEPVKTYAIGFYDARFNEAAFAKEIAAHLGTNHTETYISEEEMLGLVDSICDYYDEPFADSSQVPSMLVAKLAKKM